MGQRLPRSSVSISGWGRGRGGGRASTFSLSQEHRLPLIRAVHDALPHPCDFHLAQECLDGNASALALLQERYREPLLAFLQGAGAHPQEAVEIVAELWADCVSAHAGTGPKLARYNGICALKTFFSTITLNVLLTRRRREKRWSALVTPAVPDDTAPADSAAAAEPAEVPLLDLMREAIQAAFMACPAEDFVLLQLAHLDGLRVVELAKIFDCSTASISRHGARASRDIAAATLQSIRATDPWLELRWEDFVELCGTASPACFGVE